MAALERKHQILCAVDDAFAIARIRSAFLGRDVVRTDASQLEHFCEGPRVFAVIVGKSAIDTLGLIFFARLTTRIPSLPVIAYLRPDELLPTLAFRLAQTGISELCLMGIEDNPANFQDIADRAAIGKVIPQLRCALQGVASYSALHDLEAALGAIHHSKSPRQVAEALGVSLRALRVRLRREGLPYPKRLMAWCRLLVASKLLEDAGRSTENVALYMDYSSGPAFRNACRKLARVTPSQIREGGGLPYTTQRLKGELTRKRVAGSV